MLIGFSLVIFLVKEDKNTYGYTLRSQKGPRGSIFRAFSPYILAVLAALLFQRIARTVFSPFLPLYVQQTLGTIKGAATYTGIINGVTGLTTAVAALTITRLGDHRDKLKLAWILTLVSLPVTVLLAMTHTIPGLLMMNAIFFFLAGGVDPILTSAASEHTPPAIRGALFGMIGTVSSLGAMVSPMIGSYLTAEFSLRAVLIVIPVFTLVQCICMGFMPRGERPFGQKEEEIDEQTD